MKIITDEEVKTKFAGYPAPVRKKLQNLRKLILDTAAEISEIQELKETLKWGEPSYIAKKGSTIRIDWKEKSPEQYAIYFKCTSLLVSSFRAVYPSTFGYEKNRAIVFSMDEIIPEAALKNCIAAALQYHKVKSLPLLGL